MKRIGLIILTLMFMHAGLLCGSCQEKEGGTKTVQGIVAEIDYVKLTIVVEHLVDRVNQKIKVTANRDTHIFCVDNIWEFTDLIVGDRITVTYRDNQAGIPIALSVSVEL